MSRGWTRDRNKNEAMRIGLRAHISGWRLEVGCAESSAADEGGGRGNRYAAAAEAAPDIALLMAAV